MEPFHPTVFLPTVGRGCPPPRRQDRTDPKNLSIPPILASDKVPPVEGAPVTKGQAPADTTAPKPGSARPRPAPRSPAASGCRWKEPRTRSPGTWVRRRLSPALPPNLYQCFPTFRHP